MIQPEVAAALIAVASGVAVVAARDGRVVAIALLVAMVAAPFASSPQPTTLVVVFRILGALLAAYLLVAAARSGSIESVGSGIGITAEIALAAAAFCIGWFVAPVKPLAGPVAAQAAGVSMIALAILPLLGRDVFRVGAGAAVLVIGGSLLLHAWAGPSSSVAQVVLTALLVGVAGATSLLISPLDAPAEGQGATGATAATSAAATSAAESEATEDADAATEALAAAPSMEAAPEVAAVSRRAAGRASAGRRVAGAITRRARRPAAEAPAPSTAPDAPLSRKRPSTIRTSPFRGVRTEGWTDQARFAGGGSRTEEPGPDAPEALPDAPESLPVELESPPVGPAEVFPPPDRVRRLRPREPRR